MVKESVKSAILAQGVRRSHFDHLTVWTCNTGGPKAAWRIWSHLTDRSRPHILFLQETSFKDTEWMAYQREAYRHGFNAFYSGCQGGSGSQHRSGGAVTLVSTQIPVRKTGSCNLQGSAAQAVWFHGCLFMSLYLAPNHESHEVFCQVCDVLQSLPRSTRWLIGGDLNATPDECPFQYVIQPANICAASHPTRWQGARTIDYFITTESLQPPETPAIVISDHKMQAVKFPCHTTVHHGFTIAAAPRLPSKVPMQVWQRRIQTVWQERRTALPNQWSDDVNHDWKTLSRSFF